MMYVKCHATKASGGTVSTQPQIFLLLKWKTQPKNCKALWKWRLFCHGGDRAKSRDTAVVTIYSRNEFHSAATRPGGKQEPQNISKIINQSWGQRPLQFKDLQAYLP